MDCYKHFFTIFWKFKWRIGYGKYSSLSKINRQWRKWRALANTLVVPITNSLQHRYHEFLNWFQAQWINSDHSISRCGRDRMVVGFTTPYAFSAHHHWSREFEPRSWRGVVDLVYLIQCYVIKFFNDLRQVRVVLWVLWFPQPIMILLFIDNLAVVLSFLTLQDKHNTCTLSENKNSFVFAAKQD
jgi:hypothetical protein